MGLRGTFDEAPELYDRARPGYPEAVFVDLATLARLRPGSRVLELGCGTGQATVPLAKRGFEVVAVELGAGLAEVARRNLAAFPAVEVVNAAFEQWPLPPAPFDAVVAATSIHWLDPGSGPPQGATSCCQTALWRSSPRTMSPAGRPVVRASSAVRDVDSWHAEGPSAPERRRRAPPDANEFEASGRFTNPVLRRYERDLTYTRREYRDLLSSYSGHRALAADAREGLLACIGELIDTRFGGRIAKRYLTELTVAYRHPAA